MRRVAVVAPQSLGGVKTITNKLIMGLVKEGLLVTRIDLHGESRVLRLFRDLKNIKLLRNFDTVMYMGSMPYPSHWLVQEVRTVLFIHGYVLHEIIGILNDPYTSLRRKIKSFYLIIPWNFNRLLGGIDLYVCHSITTCEENNIRGRFVVLPQFIFPEEVGFYTRYQELERIGDNRDTRITIAAYVSSSPKLLTLHALLRIIMSLSKKIGNREVELIIVDSRIKGSVVERWNNLIVHRVGSMPRSDFLKLLASADLYMEGCIDEELRIASIEAGLLGTPVAKLTHPKFVTRQDYCDEVIWSSSPGGLVDALADYIANVEYWKPYYAKKLRNFLVTRRNWDSVKEPLVNFLKA